VMPEERLLMVVRSYHGNGLEAEPVLISVSADGRCEMTLDEGDSIVFDLAELRSVLDEEAA
jgi:hypothetical protein